ncbi:MAG: YrhK family protein [Devosia sp.]
MKLFDHGLRTASAEHARVVRQHELARTFVEFLAALAFIVGSVFFFYSSLMFAGTWLFLVGSILFGMRPAISLAQELRLVRMPVPKGHQSYGAAPVGA